MIFKLLVSDILKTSIHKTYDGAVARLNYIILFITEQTKCLELMIEIIC